MGVEGSDLDVMSPMFLGIWMLDSQLVTLFEEI